MKKLSRIPALLLCLTLVFSLCPARAFTAPTPAPWSADPPPEADFEADSPEILQDILYWVILENLPAGLSIRITDDALYRRFKEDDEFRVQVLSQAGIFQYKIIYRMNNVIILFPTVYYPANRILYAWFIDDASDLTAREKETLRKAESVISSLIREEMTPLQREKAVHDWMCDHITYDGTDTPGGMQERDTCVGGVLNGRADCDGYADTFVLLATMAHVGYVGRIDVEPRGGGYHELNTVYLDDSWYLTDVCWDDPDGGYRYMNMSENWALYLYDWKTDLFALSPVINPEYWLGPAYCIHSRSDVFRGAKEAAEQIRRDYRDGCRLMALKVAGADGKEIADRVSQVGLHGWTYSSAVQDGVCYFHIWFK